MKRGAIQCGAVTGLAGAVSVVVTELLVGGLFNGSPLARGVARLAVAGGAGFAAERLGAPEAVSCGIVAGPVLMTTLDVGVSAIGRRPRIDPPPVTDPTQAGAPWPPRPPYAP